VLELRVYAVQRLRSFLRCSPLAALAAVVAAACARGAAPTDLLKGEGGLVEALVAGREKSWVVSQSRRPVRLDDVMWRTLPAAPPSRLRYAVDVPRQGRLDFAVAVDPAHHGEPPVEFVLKVSREGREDTVWTLLLDPLNKPEHRRWVPARADLSRYAGPCELVLETRAFESAGVRMAYWGAPALTSERRPAPLVVVYLVDTLRADHTTPYGYHRDTTPELQRFAREAVLFEQAIAHASWTKPSVASLMTSLLPGRHRAVQLRDRLDDGLLTLPEMLQAKGYSTGAAIANSVIYSAGTNFEQGFDFFAGLHGADNRPSKLVEAAGVVDEALRWVEARRGLPTFLYVHTMDPHVPYAPPPPFDRKYEPHPTPENPGNDPRTDFKEPLDRERMIAQYDGDVAYGDQEFGRFVRELAARGLFEDALIVFLADHGEEFQDHGQWLHGRSVFDELVRVPLLVKLPGGAGAGRRVTQQVQVVDVLPTVLHSQGLPVPRPPAVMGRPLQHVIEGTAQEAPAVSEISHRTFVAHGMRTGRDKYVRRFSPQDDELYFDLSRDPLEKNSVLESASDRVRTLRAGVEASMVTNPFRHNLRVAGGGLWELRVRSGGWIEGVEPFGLGPQDRYEVEGSGRRLLLRLRPRPGAPREVAFSIRPMGAPVFVEGTRDGREIRPADVFIAKEGLHPSALPYQLPEIESEKERTEDIFAAPPAVPGLHVWLTLTPGRSMMEKFDHETCERLKALGYVGTCP
jgi:arylsulfatase A-like enzyme